MGKKQIRQRARQQALEAAAQQRQARAVPEWRLQNLVVQVLTAIGNRVDQAPAANAARLPP